MEEGTDESINVWKSWKVTVQSLLAFTLQVCEWVHTDSPTPASCYEGIQKHHFCLQQQNLSKANFGLHCPLILFPQSLLWGFMKILYSYRICYLIWICGRQKANSMQERQPQALPITDVQPGLVVLNWVRGSGANTPRHRIFAAHVLLQICYTPGGWERFREHLLVGPRSVWPSRSPGEPLAIPDLLN